MQAGYTVAMETQSGVCKQEQSSNLHTMHAESAGPLQGSAQQQGALPTSLPTASFNSTPAQGCCMQQPSLHTAPPTPVFPLHQGCVPQQPCPQGLPLQPCPGQAPATVRPHEAQTPALVPPSMPQQLEDEEVCCAQPALPSALPHQQLSTKGNEHRQVQVALNSKGLPADRTSSSRQASYKADQTGHATLASSPAQYGNVQRAPGAGAPASGGTVSAQSHCQGQPRGSDSSAVPDKENAGTGRMLLSGFLLRNNNVHATSIAVCIMLASASQD